MLDHRVGLKLSVAYQGIHSQSPHAVATDEQTGMFLRTALDVTNPLSVLEQILRHRFQVAVDFARKRLCANTDGATQLCSGDGGQVILGLPRQCGMTRASEEEAQLAGIVGSSVTGIDGATPLDAENGGFLALGDQISESAQRVGHILSEVTE